MEDDYRRDRQNGHREKKWRGLIAVEAAEHHVDRDAAPIDARDISDVMTSLVQISMQGVVRIFTTLT